MNCQKKGMLSSVLFVMLVLSVAKLDAQQDSVMFSAINDAFNSGTDDKFSNGLLLSFSTNYVPVPLLIFTDCLFGENSSKGNGSNFTNRYRVENSFILGQNIYTPTDTQTTSLIANDRPYAAWNYLKYTAVVSPAKFEKAKLVASISAGILGDFLGDFVQNNWHRYVLNIPTTKGWANHIEDRVAGQLELGGSFVIIDNSYMLPTYPVPENASRPRLQLISNNLLETGNVFVRASSGISLRLGYFPSSTPFDTTTQIPKKLDDAMEQVIREVKDFSDLNIDFSGYLSAVGHLTGYNGTLDLGGFRYLVNHVPVSFDLFGGMKIAVPIGLVYKNKSGNYFHLSKTLITLDISPFLLQTADFSRDRELISLSTDFSFHRFGRYSIMITNEF